MKVEQTNPLALRLTKLDRLDPVDVSIINSAPGDGSITIACCGKSWTAVWRSMGDDTTVEEFFLWCDNDYLINCLNRGINKYINDPSERSNKNFARQKVLELRREDEISTQEARTYWSLIEESEDILADCCDWLVVSPLKSLFGDDPAYAGWPTIINPDYAYLDRIVTAVKAAIKEVKDDSPAKSVEMSTLAMYTKQLLHKLSSLGVKDKVTENAARFLKDHGHINPLR